MGSIFCVYLYMLEKKTVTCISSQCRTEIVKGVIHWFLIECIKLIFVLTGISLPMDFFTIIIEPKAQVSLTD